MQIWYNPLLPTPILHGSTSQFTKLVLQKPSKELQEGFTIGHVLCHDVDGLLGDHGLQPDQFVVLELLHQVCLCQEGVRIHAALLHGLHSHLDVVLVVACRERTML